MMMDLSYDPSRWFWTVGGDESRFYSSAARGYVDALPDGAGVTRIDSEASLWEVLERQHPDGLPETPERMQARYATAIQAHLDATAGERSYDSMVSCVSYAGSTNAQWAAEAAAASAWRDAVWAQVYDLWGDPPDPVPTPEELIAGLPAIEWPQQD